MMVTTDHPESSYGIPVILDDSAAVMNYAAGLKAIRARLGLSTSDVGAACKANRRTVEGWEQGRKIPAAALNVLGDLLRRAGKPVRAGRRSPGTDSTPPA